MDQYYQWLESNGKDKSDPKLSLGYLPLGQVDLLSSFGTDDPQIIWEIMSPCLNIHTIECDGHANSYDYRVFDENYQTVQMKALGLIK